MKMCPMFEPKVMLVSCNGTTTAVFRLTRAADGAGVTFPHMVLRGEEIIPATLGTLGGLGAVALRFHVRA